MTQIKYLGHITSKDKIRMDLEKLQIINEWPLPTNLHELRSFIERFSIIASPLYDLTKKKVQFKWTAKENTAF